MKLKGVNPLEQHIEKIVLVAVAGIFLLVVAAQLLLQPNKVKVGNQPPVPPGRAFETVRTKADQVRNRMESEVDLPAVPPMNIVQDFIARREAPVAPAATLTQLGRAPQIDRVAGPSAPAGTARIAAVRVPAPQRLVAASPRGTVSPAEVLRHPQIREHLPEAQPFDKAGVSVEASFSGRALREALMAPGAEGTTAMPAGWWRDGIEILMVQLEREEMTADGTWTNLTAVPAIPGRLNIMEQVRSVRTVGDLAGVVSDAQEGVEEIRRPRYLELIAGTPWAPPSEMAKLQPQVQNPEIERQVRRLEDVRRQIVEVQGQLESMAPAGGGAGGGGAAPGGRGPAGGRAPGGAEPPRTDERERRRLEQRLTSLRTTETQIAESLRRLGYTPPTEPVEPAAGGGEQVQRPLVEDPAVRLWAHDITVQPGKVYRYRMAVGINNPIFGRAAGLVPEQQDLAASPVILSEPSAWSSPVYVLDDRYFFITTAHEPDMLGGARAPARAKAEVFQFHYGFFRRGEVQLEPGDKVIAAVKLPESAAMPIFELPELLNRNGGEDPAEVPAMGELPQQPWSRPVVAQVDSFLLDVTSVPGSAVAGGGSRTIAYLRGPSGDIIKRDPRGDEQSDLYRQVAQSAKEGEGQGQPPAQETPEPTRQPRQPRQPREVPPAGGGTGGGMGGG
jgi:hypothetical protein